MEQNGMDGEQVLLFKRILQKGFIATNKIDFILVRVHSNSCATTKWSKKYACSILHTVLSMFHRTAVTVMGKLLALLEIESV